MSRQAQDHFLTEEQTLNKIDNQIVDFISQTMILFEHFGDSGQSH